MEKKKNYKIWAGICFGLILVGLMVFLFSGENYEVLKEIFKGGQTKEEVREAIGKLGSRSYFVVLVLSMLQVVFTFVPAEPLHVISGISFGLWQGMAICFVGILIGNTIIFVLNKLFGAKLKNYFETNVDFDFNKASSSSKIALIVIILYVLPAIPYGIICFFAASMGMKYWKYILITGVGTIPSLVLDVGLGDITMSTSWAVSIGVFVAIIILLILMVKFKDKLFKMLNNYINKHQKSSVNGFNPFLYNVVAPILFKVMGKKIKMELKNSVGELEKPSIVLVNHGSFFDFLYAGKLIKKDKPHFIVARMYFYEKYLNRVLKGVGTIPKSMFSADMENIKQCLEVINRGEVLAFMPEARLSTVGVFEDIQDSTYKFIQKLGVNVYAVKINGSYLAKPKWGDKIRKGAKVEAELIKVLDKKEVKDLTEEELKNKIEKSINYNEWEWLEKHPEISYPHKTIAEGLENILAICPKCGAKYSLKTHLNKISCEHCDLDVCVDERYALSGVEFKNIAQWYNWQVEEVKKEINQNPDFKLESEVELRHLALKKGATRFAGKGKCVLTKEGLTYTGTRDNENITKVFEAKNIYRLLFGAGEDFEIYEGKELFYFVPTEKRSCVMWYIVSGIVMGR